MKITVTDKNAIYVDDFRITNRSTKWGVHNFLEEFEIEKKEELLPELKKRGLEYVVDYIDDESFLKSK